MTRKKTVKKTVKTELEKRHDTYREPNAYRGPLMFNRWSVTGLDEKSDTYVIFDNETWRFLDNPKSQICDHFSSISAAEKRIYQLAGKIPPKIKKESSGPIVPKSSSSRKRETTGTKRQDKPSKATLIRTALLDGKSVDEVFEEYKGTISISRGLVDYYRKELEKKGQL